MMRNKVEAAGIVAFSALILTACSDSKISEEISLLPSVSATTTSTAPEQINSQAAEEIINTVYPEYSVAGLRLRDAAIVSVKSQVPTTVLNFTDYEYNPDVARAIYSFLEVQAETKIVNGELLANGFKYKINNNDYLLALTPSSELIKSRVAVIVPENSPRPSWSSFDTPAFTRRHFDDSYAHSYIEASTLNSSLENQEGATAGLAVEACQQTVIVRVFDSKSELVMGVKENTIAQEVVCNSLGRLIFSRLLGNSYQRYVEALRSPDAYMVFSTLGLDEKAYPAYIFPRAVYESIPILGTVLMQ